MKIIRAAEMGMCFGVRDALQIADPTQVTIHGELVRGRRNGRPHRRHVDAR